MQKTNFKTRLLALLTAVFMVVMCVPFAAFAETNVKSIHVAFTDENAVLLKEYDITATSNKCAPELPDGYYWKSNYSSYGVSDLNSKEPINFDNLAKANWPNVGFTKTKKPEVKKEVTVNINLSDPEAGYFTNNKEAKTLTYEHLAADGKIEGLKNMVTANEGYEFTGWTWDGKGSGTLDVGATEFMYTDSAFYNGDATTGYVTLTAQFKKVEQPETQKHHFTVNFTVDPEKGSFTDYGAGPVVFQGNEEEDGDQQYNVPAVTAKEGYKFVGWKGQGASEIAWDADTKTFGISGLCFYQDGSYEGNASIEAQFEEVKPETQKHHFTVNFTVDPEKGSFTGIGAGPVVFQGYEEEVGDQQYEVPAVTAKEGYKFVGWKGQGADVIAWDAEAKTFGVTGLCFYQDGSYEGNASIEAQFEEVKPETQKHHFTVNFTVDPEKGSFTGIGAGPVVFQGYEEEVGDQQYEVPAVTAKEGYKFVGWKGQGADVIAWDAEAKTFGVTGLCFYQDGSYEGNASIEAVFEKIEDKKNDNSSSSSSASSSSNKTTTASNEKQVVKAAAAPANTTKVLPKTGASNVAPLLGGSLAVVALLMGYGVYSLVLRKKD